MEISWSNWRTCQLGCNELARRVGSKTTSAREHRAHPVCIGGWHGPTQRCGHVVAKVRVMVEGGCTADHQTQAVATEFGQRYPRPYHLGRKTHLMEVHDRACCAEIGLPVLRSCRVRGARGADRTVATILAEKNIRVNSVHPSGVATPMIENEMMNQYIQDHPSFVTAMKNLLPVPVVEAQEVAEAMIYLCDSGRYITGVTLPVDAGNRIA